MKANWVALLIILLVTPATFAIGDISIGPYYGMAIPIANDLAESGMMYGIQTKLSLIPMLSVGAHYSSRAYGNPSQVFFEGMPNEVTSEIDGGDVSTFGIEAFLGKGGSLPGINYYLTGGFSSYRWTRDYTGNFSKSAYSAGLGMEIVLPVKVGVEARGLFEFAPTGHNSTYKNILWFIGVNYHLGLGPM